MRSILILAVLLPLSVSAASGLPADAAIDPVQHKTLEPKVVPDSGRLQWVPHDQDLTPWLTHSHLDTRSVPKPQRVTFKAPLNGDVKRGRALAMDTNKGTCITCHSIPGEAWSGTVGTSLLHHKLRQQSDAELYQQIWDVRVTLPYAFMPSFGSLGLLNDQDVRDLVAFLQSLE
jgi:sulfur-oxidizing protein SoxX